VVKWNRSILDELFDLLRFTPAWVGPVLALADFALFRFLAPLVFPSSGFAPAVTRMFFQLMPLVAWATAIMVLVVWLVAEVDKLRNRNLLDSQSGIDSIRSISWRQFEALVAEAYRRQGYLAEVVGTDCGDGGVDIRLRRQSDLVLVQCKQWRAYKVGVTTIREMLGVVVSEKAKSGIVVTSGRFTQEARRFAEANPIIKVIDGPALSILIRTVQGGAYKDPGKSPASAPRLEDLHMDPPSCPSCGSLMVMRTARRGVNAGSQFWGCPKYPTCCGIRKSVGDR
jgi:restriction system protein